MIVSDFLLFAVFAFLFCMESVMISGRGTVIIFSHLLNKWEWTISETLPFFGGRHLSLKTLFPPLGSAFITGSYPVVISPAGFMLNPYEGRYSASGINCFRYSDVKTIGVSGTFLMINGSSFCRMHSDSEAGWWKDKLLLLAEISPDKRTDAVNKIIASMFDINAAEKIMSLISGSVNPLRIAVNILYIFLFIIAPLLVLFFTFEMVLIPMLVLILILHSGTCVFFYRTYRSVFEARGIPWSAIISIALYPPGMIRSIDYFFKDSLIMFNPAAVSMNLMPPENSKKIISFLIREYTFFNFTSEEVFEQQLISFYRESMLDGIKLLLEKKHLLYDEFLIPPAQHDYIESYCPRCFCQYTGKVQKCSDCSLDLVKY